MTARRDTERGWVGVDLDGTLAHYDHFRGEDHVGGPIEPMIKKVRQWLRDGMDVRLFTARKPHPVIRAWMKEHIGELLPITNVKDQGMIALYDDRVVGVRRNTGELFHEDNEKQVFEK